MKNQPLIHFDGLRVSTFSATLCTFGWTIGLRQLFFLCNTGHKSGPGHSCGENKTEWNPRGSERIDGWHNPSAEAFLWDRPQRNAPVLIDDPMKPAIVVRDRLSLTITVKQILTPALILLFMTQITARMRIKSCLLTRVLYIIYFIFEKNKHVFVN